MSPELDLDDFDYPLPPDRIAQYPPTERDGARLLCLERVSGRLSHSNVRGLPDRLQPGDLLVVNTTRVLPARLRGRKQTGGRAEALLLGRVQEDAAHFRALVRARGRLRPGQKFHFESARGSLDAELVALDEDGAVVLGFADGVDPYAYGETPLPPYIARPEARVEDAERYQTRFARQPGSVAAPTAGLHLSDALLSALTARGVGRAEILLHVGPGTFRPLRERDLAAGRLHPEPYALSTEVAAQIDETRAAGGRIVAVGTTTARTLETCVGPDGRMRPGSGETTLFLRPGSAFRAVDALLTNFHLPRSSLLLLVAAFAGRERVLEAYREAVSAGYRFYSYGDAMLIT